MSSTGFAGVDLLELFKNKLVDFVADLQGVLGHLPQYALISAAVKFVPKAHLRAAFDQHVARPYGASIAARDEAFLLSQDYEKDLGRQDGGGGVDVGVDVVPLIKSAWRSMSAQDKGSVWAHMQILLAINDRIAAAR
jgi:hypothetical protein